MLEQMKKDSKKALKKQEKLLENIYKKVQEFQESDNQHIELKNFLVETFEPLINSSQRYLNMYNTLIKNCTNIISNDFSLEEIQEGYAEDYKEKIDLVISKVYLLIKSSAKN